METQYIIIIVFFALGASLGIMFVFHRKKMLKEGSQIIKELTRLKLMHEQQIAIRTEFLNRYDFLQYNLKESLKIQKEILV